MTAFNVKFAPGGSIQRVFAKFTPDVTNVITLKNNSAAGRLDQLLDVTPDTANTVAGSTLVYDPTTDKYVVKMLDLDGGVF
jgi:hypothetical protein